MTPPAAPAQRQRRSPVRSRMPIGECQERIRVFLVEHRGDGVQYTPRKVADKLGLPHSSVATAIKAMIGQPRETSFVAARDMPKVWARVGAKLPAVPEAQETVDQGHTPLDGSAFSNDSDGDMVDGMFFVPAGHIQGRPVVRDPDGELYEIRKLW
jgi:hypothetical protein